MAGRPGAVYQTRRLQLEEHSCTNAAYSRNECHKAGFTRADQLQGCIDDQGNLLTREEVERRQ